MLETGYEPVHTVTDYYDGPRKGIADFEGSPHFYEAESDYLPDESFRLSPVKPQLFALALESWRIWRRWETALHEGRATRETHPALPEDRVRYDELAEVLDRELRIDDKNFVRTYGDFKPRDDSEWSGLGWRPLQVKWRRR